MNPMDIDFLMQKWRALGFRPTRKRAGQLVWKDCCVVQSMSDGPTLPCDWLEMGADGQSAFLKGSARW